MMLGEMRLEQGMFPAPTPVLIGNLLPDPDHAGPNDLDWQIEKAGRAMPAGAYRERSYVPPPETIEIDASAQKEGAYFLEAGESFSAWQALRRNRP